VGRERASSALPTTALSISMAKARLPTALAVPVRSARYTQDHGIIFKEHCFVWGNQQPGGSLSESDVRNWIKKPARATRTSP